MEPTQFEQLLAQYFPDIYQLHILGKNEAHLWELLQLLLAMHAKQITGRVEILYTKGHIDTIKQTVDLLAFKGRPGY